MNLDSLFQNDDLKKHKKQKTRRAVINEDSKIFCYVNKKHIYNINGKAVGNFKDHYKEEVSTNRFVEVFAYEIDERLVEVKEGHLFLDNKVIGRLLPKINRTPRILLSLAGILTLVIIGLLLFGQTKDEIYPSFSITEGKTGLELTEEIDFFSSSNLAPGSSGYYSFTVQNPHEVSIIGSLSFNFTYNDEPMNFLTYDLKLDNASVNWTKITSSSYVIEDLQFLSNSGHTFTVYWKWPFDGNNESDTEIGQNGGVYKLYLEFKATVAD